MESLLNALKTGKATYDKNIGVEITKRDFAANTQIRSYEQDAISFIELYEKASGDDRKKFLWSDYSKSLPLPLQERYAGTIRRHEAALEIEHNENSSDQTKRQEKLSTSSTHSKRFDPNSFKVAKDVKIHIQAANELTSEQLEEFKDLVYDYFKIQVFKLRESDEIPGELWMPAYVSYLASLNEQSTSRENEHNPNLLNSFEAAGTTYTWDRSAIIKAVQNVFTEKYAVSNAERRFKRADYSNIQTILTNSGYKPTQRLAAQWGVAGGYRGDVSDATPIYKSHGSAKQQTAQMAASEYATTKDSESSDVVHTSQILGTKRRR